MTETAENITETSLAPKPPKKAWLVTGFLLLILASAVGGAVVFKTSSFLHSFFPPPVDPHTTQILDRLEDRVRMLEHRLETTPEAVALPDQESAQKISDLTGRVDGLQNQVTTLANQHGHDVHVMQQIINTEWALRDLRDAVAGGQNYAAPLAAVEQNIDPHMRQEPKIAAALNVLFDHSAGIPTLADLRQELTAHEPDLAVTANPDFPLWLQHLQKSARSLISIHPAYNSIFEPLEQALTKKNSAEALKAFDALPDTARQNLSAWHDRLILRQQTEDAVTSLAHSLNPDGAMP